MIVTGGVLIVVGGVVMGFAWAVLVFSSTAANVHIQQAMTKNRLIERKYSQEISEKCSTVLLYTTMLLLRLAST